MRSRTRRIRAYLLHDARLALGEGGIAAQLVIDELHFDLNPAFGLLACRRILAGLQLSASDGAASGRSGHGAGTGRAGGVTIADVRLDVHGRVVVVGRAAAVVVIVVAVGLEASIISVALVIRRRGGDRRGSRVGCQRVARMVRMMRMERVMGIVRVM